MTEQIAKRKKHSKSRNGCFQCKKRHTKCNEVRPRCANCVRLDIHCSWPTRPDGFSTTSYLTPPESHISVLADRHASASPENSANAFGSELAIDDMRLLHHYTSKTYKDMNPEVTSKHAFWQTNVIEVGFENPWLLRGYLALAAIHKAVTEPHADRQRLLLQADSHISKALLTYRENLGQPNVEISIPMFLLSSVLVIYNLAGAQLETPEDPINAIHHCFRLLQGVKVVVYPYWAHIRASDVYGHMVEMVEDPKTNERIQEVDRLKEVANVEDTTNRDAYTAAIEELHRLWLLVRSCVPGQDQLAVSFYWPGLISERFTHLVSIHDPVAVLILGYWAALLAECRPTWWVREWPQRLVFAARKLLMAMPELLKWMEWPMQAISATT